MIRTVDLSAYIPDFFRQYGEMEEIQNAAQPEIQKMEDETERIIKDQYIDTTDEKGIAIYEKMLGIQPLDDDTLDNRQFRVLSRWNRYVPYTKKTLRRKLELLCGKDRYTVADDTAGKRLTVRVSLKSRQNYRDVETLLEEMTPANMVIDLSLFYNQNIFLAKMPHFRLAEYTHHQLRDQIIEYYDNSVVGKMTHGQLKQFTQDTIRKGVL